MSRSYRKAINKDKGLKDYYHKIGRSRINQFVKKFIKEPELEELKIPQSKEIMGDYDYCDKINDYEYTLTDPKKYSEEKIKNRRK